MGPTSSADTNPGAVRELECDGVLTIQMLKDMGFVAGTTIMNEAYFADSLIHTPNYIFPAPFTQMATQTVHGPCALLT